MLSFNVTISILTIPNVTIQDVGAYYCVAWANRISTESLDAKLFLAGKMYLIVVLCVIIIISCTYIM